MFCSVKRLFSALVVRPAAVNRLIHLSLNRPHPAVLRVSVEAGGCSGFKYNLSLVNLDSKSSDDELFSQDGCYVLVDKTSMIYLKECEIDFYEDMARSAFQVVSNNLATAKCGCGASFNIDF